MGGKNHENPNFLASKVFIQNRFDESSNLAHRVMHAKFELIWIIRLLRAMGVVRKLNPHLIIGGNLYASAVAQLIFSFLRMGKREMTFFVKWQQ